MKILITGGAGCLGSNLIEHYLPLGHEIFVIDNFATGRKELVPNIDGLSLVEGSISDSSLMMQVFNDFSPTHVIHSAAAYKDPFNWIEDSKTNILGTINVAEAAKKIGVERFINFQTALCYGRPMELPIPINHPTAPFTSYGISKTAGEAYLLQSDLPLVSLRLANICGPRLAIGPIPTFYMRLKSGKECFCSDTIRDFIDISDFFNLMDLVLQDENPMGIFNVSTGEGHSILDVFNAVTSYLQLDPIEVPVIPVGDDDVQEMVLDPIETYNKYAWKAKIDFITMIEKQLKWYDQHGVNNIFSHLTHTKLNKELV